MSERGALDEDEKTFRQVRSTSTSRQCRLTGDAIGVVVAEGEISTVRPGGNSGRPVDREP